MNSNPEPFQLTARDLEVWRGETRLLKAVDLELGEGDLLWMRGPNGSGKTSLMRCLLGLAPLEAGQVYWCGRPMNARDPDFLADVAWCGHRTGMRGELSPRENLAAWLAVIGRKARASVSGALDRVGLGSRADLPCGLLSAGQLRRAALARLLLSPARFWCLDEPLTGLDADGIRLVGQLLSEHCANRGAALVSSHQPLPDNTGATRELVLQAGEMA